MVYDGSGDGSDADADIESSGIGPDDEDALSHDWGSGDGSEGDDEDGKVRPGFHVKSQSVDRQYEYPPEGFLGSTTNVPEDFNVVEETGGIKTSFSSLPASTTTPTTPAQVSILPSGSRPLETNNVTSTISRKESLDPFLRPGILAAVIGGAVVGLLASILIVMFVVYRMRKKDEGSYALDEPKSPPNYAYTKASLKEVYA